MTPRYAKVSEIAERYRVSVDAVYLWIRQGKIPAECVVRIAGTVRVDEEQFEVRLRSGSLYQSRGRKPSRGDYSYYVRTRVLGLPPNTSEFQPDRQGSGGGCAKAKTWLRSGLERNRSDIKTEITL